METQTLYDVLQVIPGAEQEVIDAAYRRLCRKYHPDVNRDAGAGRKMNLFNEAYSVLRHPERRAAYDRKLSAQRALEPAPRMAEPTTRGERQDAEVLETGRQTLAAYFSLLQQQEWHKAYALLCHEDRRRVTLHDFLSWQEAVSELFELGEVSITLHRPHRDGQQLRSAEYVVEGREIDLAADQWHAFVSIKHLLLEPASDQSSADPVAADSSAFGEKASGNPREVSWRVQLGYEDVRALATRFRLMAQSLHPRVLREKELLEMAEQEAYRSRRFQYPFSLAAFQVLPTQPLDAYIHLWEARKLNWVSRAMDSLRLSDVLAWTESGDGILVLPHTDALQAEAAMEKLRHQLMVFAAREGTEALVVWCASQYDGGPVLAWRDRLARSLRAKLRGAVRKG